MLLGSGTMATRNPMEAFSSVEEAAERNVESI